MKEKIETQEARGKRRGPRAAILAALLAVAAAVTVFACRPGLLLESLSPLAARALDKPAAAAGLSAVTTTDLNLRSGEGTSAPVIRTLNEGTPVTLLTSLSAESGWVKVRTGSGETGWCAGTYLSVGGSASSSPQSAAPSSAVSSSPASSAPAPSAASQISLATAAAQVSLGQAEKPLSVSVSIAGQRVTVYDAESRIVEQFVCSTGGEGSETPTGTFRVAERGKSFYNERIGEGGYYWTQFQGNYLFHSVPFDKDYNLEPEEAAKLGTPVSHGCVRLSVENAKWIYDHIPRGAVVTIR